MIKRVTVINKATVCGSRGEFCSRECKFLRPQSFSPIHCTLFGALLHQDGAKRTLRFEGCVLGEENQHQI